MIDILKARLERLEAERIARIASLNRRLFGCRPSAFPGRLETHGKRIAKFAAEHDAAERALRQAVSEAKRSEAA